MIVPAILAAALGVLCCLVLLGYFGGRRGRALYGLDLPRDPDRGLSRPASSASRW